MKILRNVNETELSNFQREVYIMQQCSFDRNIVQFYGGGPGSCPAVLPLRARMAFLQLLAVLHFC